jgi:uncharacterized SAM-binding protein YcdF (DUF218 family)
MTTILNPMVILFILILLTLVLKWSKRFSHGKLSYISLIWLFIIAFSPIPDLLVYSLESQNRTISSATLDKKEPLNILILGSGQTNDITLTYLNRLGTSGLGRLTEGIRIYKKIGKNKIVCSGFSNGKSISQAKMLALAALEIGVNEKDTLMLIKPAITDEEAIEYKKRFGVKKAFFLVTNAVHMPRALWIFKSQGLKPIPVPANNYLKWNREENYKLFYPSYRKIEMMDKAMHEYFGMAYFYLKQTI